MLLKMLSHTMWPSIKYIDTVRAIIYAENNKRQNTKIQVNYGFDF